MHTTVHIIFFRQFKKRKKNIYRSIIVCIKNIACFKYWSYFRQLHAIRRKLASLIVWLAIFIVGRDNSLAAVLTIHAGMLSWPADFVLSREFNNFKTLSSSTSLKWKTSLGKFCVFILTILSWFSYLENTSCRYNSLCIKGGSLQIKRAYMIIGNSESDESSLDWETGIKRAYIIIGNSDWDESSLDRERHWLE